MRQEVDNVDSARPEEQAGAVAPPAYRSQIKGLNLEAMRPPKAASGTTATRAIFCGHCQRLPWRQNNFSSKSDHQNSTMLTL